jgi:PEP-CTERM motif
MRVTPVLFLVAALTTMASSAFGAAPIVSTFDTNLDGWTSQGTGAVVWFPVGNPGGSAEYNRFISFPDLYAVAPAKFTGNLSAYDGQTFSFDAELTKVEAGNPQSAFGRIDLYYGGLPTPISQDIAPGVPTTSWQTYSGPFTAAGFGVSQAQWNTALAGVDKLTIFYSPFDVTMANSPTLLDNVILTPEPGSLSVLALGMIGLLRRKRTA